MSYWDDPLTDETVRVTESQEVPCHRCHGSGLVLVHGQETDCIDCEGFGSVLIT